MGAMNLTQNQVQQVKDRKWHHQIDFGDGLVSAGNVNCRGKVRRMQLPVELKGKKVLDVGTRDGGLAFEFERLGADEVVANDVTPIDRFNFKFAKACLGSAVKFVQADLYALPFCRLPKFDIVNYSGVIYHVSDPYLSLMAMRELCRDDGIIIVESAVLDRKSYAVGSDEKADPSTMEPNPLTQIQNLLQYLPKGSVNSWVPSIDALAAICEDCGLKILHSSTWGSRVIFKTTPSEKPRFGSLYARQPIKQLLGTVEVTYL